MRLMAQLSPLLSVMRVLSQPRPLSNTAVLLDVANMQGDVGPVASRCLQLSEIQHASPLLRGGVNVCAFVEQGILEHYITVTSQCSSVRDLRRIGRWSEVHLPSGKNAADLSIVSYLSLAWTQKSCFNETTCVVVTNDMKLRSAVGSWFPRSYAVCVDNQLRGLDEAITTLMSDVRRQ